MSQEFRSCAHARHPTAEEIAGGPHGSGIGVGLREHATAEPHRHLVHIDFVVFRLAAVNGVHVEGVSEHEGDALAGAQVRQPGSR